MSAGAAAGLRFIELGGVTVYVEYHVAKGVAYLGVWVYVAVDEKPEGVCVIFSPCLLIVARKWNQGW